MMHTPTFLETDPQTAVHRQREADAVQMAVDTSMLPGSGASLPPLSVYANDSTGTQRGDEALPCPWMVRGFRQMSMSYISGT